MAEPSPPSFAELDARIRAGVEAVAGHPEDSRDPFAGLYLSDEQALALSAECPPPRVEERLGEVAALLELDAIERGVLAVCAAPELSWRYGRLYGYLHDDLTRQLASPRLAAALLCDTTIAAEQVLARLAPDAPLRRLGAIRVIEDPRLPLADRALKCTDPLAATLLGCASAGPPAPACEIVEVPALDPAPLSAIEELRSALGSDERLALAIAGPDAPAALARALDRRVLLASIVDAEDPERLPSLRLAATLARATLAYSGFERLAPERLGEVWRVLAAEPERTLVCLEDSSDATPALAGEPALLLTIPSPALPERVAAWSAQLPGCEIEEVAVKFRLSIAQISRAAQIARARAHARSAAQPSAEELDRGAREASRHGLGRLARRVEVESLSWDALMLPGRSLRALRTIATFLRHRDRVLAEWHGAGHGPASEGLTMLFAGESGTGKTMAAGVLAHELGLDLYRIDLATVVSKYIGETEKNLDRIFAAAEGSNAILLFDEADALFGKRSEVHDAHDRYANVEVAYLLQRIERYAGATILTTNLRQNIDEAFLRRLDMLVDFPFPEAPERERLWRLLLPPGSAIASEQLQVLSAHFKLSGGSIRNASLAAALLAAGEGAVLDIEHLRRAVALEYGKLGRLTIEADLQPAAEQGRPRPKG